MIRSMLAVGCIGVFAGSVPTSCWAERADDEATYIKVEIRGTMNVPTEKPGQVATHPSVRAGGLTIDLEFKDPSPARDALKKLHQRTVVIHGTMKSGGGNRLVCMVDGEIEEARAATQLPQYLVGYHDEAQAAAVESLCRSMGLKVIDRYKPGKYLVVEVTKKADDRFLEKLKEDRAVRYVEKNAEQKIPEK